MENNFEKEVRQKMEELSLTPSSPVWEGVQAAIRRRRDRRRVVLWLLPLLLLGGGISYLVFEKNNPVPVSVHPQKETKKNNDLNTGTGQQNNRETEGDQPQTNVPSSSVPDNETVSHANSFRPQYTPSVARESKKSGQVPKSRNAFPDGQFNEEADK